MKKHTKLIILLVLLLLSFNGLIAQDSYSGAPPQFGFDTLTRTQFWGYSPMFLFNTITDDESTEIIAFSLPFGFDTRSFNIVASASPSYAGTVTGQGTYASQQTVSLMAEAHEGYLFVNWTEGGEEVSTDAIYNFIAQDNRELVAHFMEDEPIYYSLSLEANPENAGTLHGAGSYTGGSQILIIASATDTYLFTNWTDEADVILSGQPAFNFVMPAEDVILTANFEESQSPEYFTLNLYTLPHNNAGGGAFGGGTYPAGSQITITANPNLNFSFLEWRNENQNPISQQAQYTFTLDANRVITAVFGGDSYTIATNSDLQQGSTSGGGTYFHNEIVQVQAYAAESYQFLRWMEGEQQASVLYNYLFSAQADRNLMAEFIPDWNAFKDNSALIIATAQPPHIGVVLNQGYHTIGETITLTASPNTGLDFVKWTEDGLDIEDGNGDLVGMEYSFEVDGDRELVAIFGGDTYTISLEANPEDAAVLAGDGEYYHGDFAFVEVLEHEGFDFYNWTQNQQQVSVNPGLGFTVTQDRMLMANFVTIPAATYSLTLSVYPENTGTVSGMGSYEAGAQVELSATANEGFRFVKWTDDQGQQLSDEAQFTYTMPEGDVSLTAHFTDAVSVAEINSAHILIYPNPTREYVNVVADVVLQKITITDITGKNVLHNPVRQKQTRIATHTLEYGIYLLHIHTAQGVFVRKLQISR